MSEKLPDRWPSFSDDKAIESLTYQTTAYELLESCLYKIGMEKGVETLAEQSEVYGLDFHPPGDDVFEAEDEAEDEDTLGHWEAVEVKAYPTGYIDPDSKEVAVTVDFNQFVDDEYLELIKRYSLVLVNGKYRLESCFYLYDGAPQTDGRTGWYKIGLEEVCTEHDIRQLIDVVHAAEL